jgi:hypothetical protein
VGERLALFQVELLVHRTAALSSPRKDVDMKQDDAGSAPMLGSVANRQAILDDWISVSDYLPEEGKVVMILHRPVDTDGKPSYPGTPGYGGGIVETGHWASIESEGCWILESGQFSPCGPIVSATHWMPLPAPPTDGK